VVELVRHALAEREVDTVGMVDVQAKSLGSRLVKRDQLDRRIEVAQPLLDLPLKFVQSSFRLSSICSP
jgi:hypothetical protein